ncbi:MAG: RagB/SusD family nutrient uptake outer membrane protein [Saprospiraceae bacterium]|nr:RagB/SusD family nutrient uptake outer membrane protein [Lewinella sp.]
MKSIKINILALAALFSLFSCKEEFLELEPYQSVDLESAIETIDGYKAAVLGTYSGMQSSNYYGRYFILVPDVMSDNVKQNSQANRAALQSDFNVVANDGIVSGMWNTIYNVIARANTVINADAEIPDAVADDRDQLVGEAYTIRALAHFDLVRIYAQHYGYASGNSQEGVPIVTVFDKDSRPRRNTVAEVYSQVVSDLTQAISLLNMDLGSARISQNAAKALLARVYLYMGEYGLAKSLADEVINSGDYELLSNSAYVDAWSNGGSPESIFEIAFNEVDNNGSDALGRMYIVNGYGDYLPAGDLLDLIPEGDVRWGLFKEDTNLSGEYGTLRVDKYPNPSVQNNTPVIRLSEVYLIRAEASARTGDEDGARADLDAIRMRALPTAEATTAGGDDLIDAILTERRIELMFEGQRLWDLMRTKQDLVRNNCTNSVCELTYPSDRFISPIPQSELDANENMTQNPSY